MNAPALRTLVLWGAIWGVGTVKAKSEGEPINSDDSSATSQMIAPAAPRTENPQAVRVSSLATSDLVEFKELDPVVQRLLSDGLELTRQNLSYKYGSDDPTEGGMDCSGTIHYLLAREGLRDVPRDASDFYAWVWRAGQFQAVVSPNASTFELSRLKPGDLMFWTGTYRVSHDPPVTHVMIYLGTSRLTGRRVMVGASDGRTFNDKQQFGVSVFDFKMPGTSSDKGGSGSRFIGYSPIPGLAKAADALGRSSLKNSP